MQYKNKQRAISKQRLNEHVPAETSRTPQYSYNGNGGVFYLVRAEELKRRQSWQSSSVVSWKSACEGNRLVWNGRQPGIQLVEGWQLSWALHGRLRRGGAIVESIVNKNWVAGYSPDSNDVNAGSWGISTVNAVARERPLKTQQAGKGLVGDVVICKVWRLAIALQLLVDPDGVYKRSINPIHQSKLRLYSHTPKYLMMMMIIIIIYLLLWRANYSVSKISEIQSKR
jgi:hypothetical protein